jgi:hypothetical protein
VPTVYTTCIPDCAVFDPKGRVVRVPPSHHGDPRCRHPVIVQLNDQPIVPVVAPELVKPIGPVRDLEAPIPHRRQHLQDSRLGAVAAAGVYGVAGQHP